MRDRFKKLVSFSFNFTYITLQGPLLKKKFLVFLVIKNSRNNWLPGVTAVKNSFLSLFFWILRFSSEGHRQSFTTFANVKACVLQSAEATLTCGKKQASFTSFIRKSLRQSVKIAKIIIASEGSTKMMHPNCFSMVSWMSSQRNKKKAAKAGSGDQLNKQPSNSVSPWKVTSSTDAQNLDAH